MLLSNSSYKTIDQLRDKVILFPLGAIEQHGPHLAVSTDTDIVSRVASNTEQKMPDNIVF
jgi:creatinine amidohydrolase